jgi:hypothetical protein
MEKDGSNYGVIGRNTEYLTPKLQWRFDKDGIHDCLLPGRAGVGAFIFILKSDPLLISYLFFLYCSNYNGICIICRYFFYYKWKERNSPLEFWWRSIKFSPWMYAHSSICSWYGRRWRSRRASHGVGDIMSEMVHFIQQSHQVVYDVTFQCWIYVEQ